ncbi:MAG: DUF924 domain-containing protein [Proteobacteria bacterium]|nr:DUF924 domain-containing protein [Pseudomonadota bacterium]
MDEARGIRQFWFGTLPLDAAALDERMRFWFGGRGRAARDELIRSRYGALLERAAGGALDNWGDGPRRRLSLIILFDQFPRHVHRGTARAFAWDERALALALSGMQSAADAALDPVERIFFYMPLQHAENREVQDESVAAYRRLLQEAPQPLQGPFAGALRSADNHRGIVERFGRFPARNAVLGRDSTPEEVAWLAQGGERFGQ